MCECGVDVLEKLGARIGQSAVETMGFVEFDPVTSLLSFRGVKVTDITLIGMDSYRLTVSSGV